MLDNTITENDVLASYAALSVIYGNFNNDYNSGLLVAEVEKNPAQVKIGLNYYIEMLGIPVLKTFDETINNEIAMTAIAASSIAMTAIFSLPSPIFRLAFMSKDLWAKSVSLFKNIK